MENTAPVVMCTAIVLRGLYAWEYSLFRPATSDAVFECPSMAVGYETRENAVRQAILAVSYEDWSPDQDDVFPLIENADDLAEMKTWSAWRRKYDHLIAEGKYPDEAHRDASHSLLREN